MWGKGCFRTVLRYLSPGVPEKSRTQEVIPRAVRVGAEASSPHLPRPLVRGGTRHPSSLPGAASFSGVRLRLLSLLCSYGIVRVSGRRDSVALLRVARVAGCPSPPGGDPSNEARRNGATEPRFRRRLEGGRPTLRIRRGLPSLVTPSKSRCGVRTPGDAGPPTLPYSSTHTPICIQYHQGVRLSHGRRDVLGEKKTHPSIPKEENGTHQPLDLRVALSTLESEWRREERGEGKQGEVKEKSTNR